MATHPVQPSVTPAFAWEIYRALGPLSLTECYMLHELSEGQQKRYLANIYGYHAAKIARHVYAKWERGQKRAEASV